MKLVDLIAALSEPTAYAHPVQEIAVHQTHISVVFLAGEFAYKVKKPVKLGFLDFSTLEKRHHYCQEEVRLNRRLAASVYLGVVPITNMGSELKVAGAGEIVEWAVQMVRLPESASLLWLLRHGEVSETQIRMLARRIAEFHRTGASGPHIAEYGRFDIVAKNARDNFAQSQGHTGVTISEPVFQRFRELTERALQQLQPLIEARAARGVPRDTHGDLRLDHVYFFPERSAPDDCLIIDCIEFHERYRFADPVADVAFLLMDFLVEGRPDLVARFREEYFSATQDRDGEELLSFYIAYRAAVRGKVEGMKYFESEVPVEERQGSLATARCHWLQGLAQLEEPARRPGLILMAGLPGSGKSTLARHIGQSDSFHVIRSDEVRKELTRDELAQHAKYGEGIYSADWTERTYAECLRRAQQAIFEGRRVIVDATFRSESRRRQFFSWARSWAVPCALWICTAPVEVIRTRLKNRKGDASDADWAIYQRTASEWEAFSPDLEPRVLQIDTSDPAVGERAQGFLRSMGLR